MIFHNMKIFKGITCLIVCAAIIYKTVTCSDTVYGMEYSDDIIIDVDDLYGDEMTGDKNDLYDGDKLTGDKNNLYDDDKLTVDKNDLYDGDKLTIDNNDIYGLFDQYSDMDGIDLRRFMKCSFPEM